jgi:hypothetical protein
MRPMLTELWGPAGAIVCRSRDGTLGVCRPAGRSATGIAVHGSAGLGEAPTTGARTGYRATVRSTRDPAGRPAPRRPDEPTTNDSFPGPPARAGRRVRCRAIGPASASTRSNDRERPKVVGHLHPSAPAPTVAISSLQLSRSRLTPSQRRGPKTPHSRAGRRTGPARRPSAPTARPGHVICARGRFTLIAREYRQSPFACRPRSTRLSREPAPSVHRPFSRPTLHEPAWLPGHLEGPPPA